MNYPLKIGIDIPESVRDNFEKEEHEYLVACVNTGDHGTIKSTKLDNNGCGIEGEYHHLTDIIGSIDLTTGTKMSGKGAMRWTTLYTYYNHATRKQREEAEELKKWVEEYFKPGAIYRVKALPPKSLPNKEFFNNEYHLHGMYITEVLNDNEKNEYLQNLLDYYFKKVTVSSELFGVMTLNKEVNLYIAKKIWRKKEVSLYVKVKDEKDDPTNDIAVLEQFWNKKTRWDEKYRAFAAKELLDLAIDWQDDSSIILDSGMLKKRLSVESISIEKGELTICYDDGDLFGGHAIMVSGTIDEGPQKTELFG